ncbi:MAG: hypothetical protein ICV81_02375 [Flavisolibacter sp.]|nr:hypothetical protein [Flavisolibacter sp.]
MGLQIKIITGLFLVIGFGFWFFSPKEQKDWYKQLPDCPCSNPDGNGVQLGDGWAKDIGNIETYHKGATECFRSYPAVETSAGRSGQQCCYNEEGKLIPFGSGAGTPDKISTCEGENKDGVMTVRYSALMGHFFKDVLPFKIADSKENAWKKYNQEWVPNKGRNCDSFFPYKTNMCKQMFDFLLSKELEEAR